MYNRKVHGRRAMLNKPGFCGTASIVAEVTDTSGWKPGCNARGDVINSPNAYEAEPDVSVTISDCSRSISLEFDVRSPEDRANNLYKVDQMIRALTEFRKGLLIEHKRYAERRKFIEARKEAQED